MVEVAVPLITAGGTVVAAILTGFGAATLKRRWDEKAESQRWNSERSERRREELRLAFMQYFEAIRRIEQTGIDVWLTGRNEIASDRTRDQGDATANPNDALESAVLDQPHIAIIINGTVAGDLLMMLLGPRAAVPFTNHVRDLDDWVKRMLKLGAEGVDSTQPPDKLPLVRIAHGLLGRDCATTAGRHFH
jgi:hypothetical protein